MIGFTPNGELIEHGRDQLFEDREIPVVGADSARQFPDTLYGVQLGTVGREKIQDQLLAMIPQPRVQESGMMPCGVIYNHDHPSPLPPMTQQLDQEGQKRLRFEFGFATNDQSSAFGMNGPVQTHRFPSGRVQDHRIDVFGRDPHGTA